MTGKIIPKKLKPGDTIGVVCPSAGINKRARHRIENAKVYLESIGFGVKLGNAIFVDDSAYTSGTISERVADIHDMFLDDSVKMILCGIGGNHSNQLLRHLDYDLIGKHPKIFMGYSDITAIHYAMYTQANLITYYGPCAATQFGEYPKTIDYTKKSFWSECIAESVPRFIAASLEWTDEFLDWFQQEDLTRARSLRPNNGYRVIRHGKKVTAKITPCCIMAVNRLAGTRYWINPDDNILILDILLSQGELNFALLDAYLTDLSNMGVFDDLKGLIISRLSSFSVNEEAAFYRRLNDLTERTDYPIIANFDIGHTDPINTLRYGQLMLIDTHSSTPIKLVD